MFTDSIDHAYANLIHNILRHGERVTTRNSAVRRVFAEKMVFYGTPLVGVRKTAWKNALREWEWFMSGSCDINALHPSVRHWWMPWADKYGCVPNNYSEQFRYAHGAVADGECRSNWKIVRADQIELLTDGVKDHPYSRRNVITTWNTAEMVDPSTPITNCHTSLLQTFVNPDDSLHVVTYQRSADVVCGLPHNWIQAWAFLLWLAHRGGRSVGSLTWIGGDVHIYDEHENLARRVVDSVGECKPTPNLVYTPSGEDFRADDFSLDGAYEPVICENAKMVV